MTPPCNTPRKAEKHRWSKREGGRGGKRYEHSQTAQGEGGRRRGRDKRAKGRPATGKGKKIKNQSTSIWCGSVFEHYRPIIFVLMLAVQVLVGFSERQPPWRRYSTTHVLAITSHGTGISFCKTFNEADWTISGVCVFAGGVERMRPAREGRHA